MGNNSKMTVLVTGFGLFGTYQRNASWEAVKLLPEMIDKWEGSNDINLIIVEIPVAYDCVTNSVKQLWEEHKPAIIVHVGVSHCANCLTIETKAHSVGYDKPDIFSNCPVEDNIDPCVLETKCDARALCEAVNKNTVENGCTACCSENAGRFLCEYIFYQSLSLGEPQVVFVHVPILTKYTHTQTAKGLFDIVRCLIERSRNQYLK